MKKLDKTLLYEKIIGNIEKDLSLSKIGGASVLVLQDGETLLDERRGYSDIETKKTLSEDSLFRLASMTKPISGIITKTLSTPSLTPVRRLPSPWPSAA